ncbi:MAG TPA: DUF393 domain-containing protein [Phycisphaerales bacterium]|nr:DUF393 domain-containing protein [Phycisphaerales bacterium]
MIYVLYDGHCNLCRRGAPRLARLARPGSVTMLDFRAPGVLERFPQLTPDQAERAMQLIDDDGRVHSGAAAILGALRTRPVLAPLAWLYARRPLRWLIDRAYGFVARNRFRLFGRAPAEPCAAGTCPLPPDGPHQLPPSR